MSKLSDEALLRTVAEAMEEESNDRSPRPRDRKRIEVIASRLEDFLKMERNKEGRLAGMVARGFGGPAGQLKTDAHPEQIPAGIVGQIEALLDKLAKSNDGQAVLISKLEELM